MGRFSVSVDSGLLDEVRRLSGARSKKEALERALKAYVRRERLDELARLAGSGLVEMSPEELEAWRATGKRVSGE